MSYDIGDTITFKIEDVTVTGVVTSITEYYTRVGKRLFISEHMNVTRVERNYNNGDIGVFTGIDGKQWVGVYINGSFRAKFDNDGFRAFSPRDSGTIKIVGNVND